MLIISGYFSVYVDKKAKIWLILSKENIIGLILGLFFDIL